MPNTSEAYFFKNQQGQKAQNRIKDFFRSFQIPLNKKTAVIAAVWLLVAAVPLTVRVAQQQQQNQQRAEGEDFYPDYTAVVNNPNSTPADIQAAYDAALAQHQAAVDTFVAGGGDPNCSTCGSGEAAAPAVNVPAAGAPGTNPEVAAPADYITDTDVKAPPAGSKPLVDANDNNRVVGYVDGNGVAHAFAGAIDANAHHLILVDNTLVTTSAFNPANPQPANAGAPAGSTLASNNPTADGGHDVSYTSPDGNTIYSAHYNSGGSLTAQSSGPTHVTATATTTTTIRYNQDGTQTIITAQSADVTATTVDSTGKTVKVERYSQARVSDNGSIYSGASNGLPADPGTNAHPAAIFTPVNNTTTANGSTSETNVQYADGTTSVINSSISYAIKPDGTPKLDAQHNREIATDNLNVVTKDAAGTIVSNTTTTITGTSTGGGPGVTFYNTVTNDSITHASTTCTNGTCTVVCGNATNCTPSTFTCGTGGICTAAPAKTPSGTPAGSGAKNPSFVMCNGKVFNSDFCAATSTGGFICGGEVCLGTQTAAINSGGSGGGTGGTGGTGGGTDQKLTPVPVTGKETPTPAIVTNNLTIALSLSLQAIGNTGSNSSPTGGGNPSPRTTTRPITVQLFDQTNNKVAEKSGQITFGNNIFTGTVDMGTVASGSYIVKVQSPRYLRKQIPGIISASTTTPLSATLVVGDINGDNILNILDYNVLSTCFGNKFSSSACTGLTNHQNADLNDDGVVDGIDYNFFVSNLSTQNGD